MNIQTTGNGNGNAQLDLKVNRRRGPVLVPGTLRATAKQLRFQPSAFSRLVGAPAETFAIGEVTDVVDLEAGSVRIEREAAEALQFQGDDIHKLKDFILALPLGELTPTRLQLRLHEHVLVSSTCACADEDGEHLISLSLTSQRLHARYCDYEGEELVLLEEKFAVDLSRLNWPGAADDDGVLELGWGARKVLLRGEAVAQLEAAWGAIERHRERGGELRDLRLHSWSARLRAGGKESPRLSGQASLSESHLYFHYAARQPNGKRIKRPPPVSFPLSEMERLRFRGRVDRRLILSGDSGRWSLSGNRNDMNDLYTQLTQYWAQLPMPVDGSSSIAGAPTLTSGIESMLMPWVPELGNLAIGPVFIFEPCAHVSLAKGARRGWLLLNPRVVMWIPMHGADSGQELLRMHCPEIVRPGFASAEQQEIRAIWAYKELRLIPERGAETVQLFWDLLEIFAQRTQDVDAPVIADLFNRRQAYRAPLLTSKANIQFRSRDPKTGTSKMLSCRLLNVSLGGCALVSKVQLEIGASHTFGLPYPDGRAQTLKLAMRIVYARHEPQLGGWVHGAAFLGVNRMALDRLVDLWMDHQRRESSERM